MDINGTLLSVIIPVYNEEKNVSRILDKLDSQLLSHFEVIIIDDGSTDHTISIIEDYVPSKFSLRLLKQKNGGAASARQYGIKNSVRDYIAIIDCDDDIAFDTLSVTLGMFKNNNVDIVLFDLYYTGDRGSLNKERFRYFTDDGVVSGALVFNHCIADWGVHAFGIYKRAVLSHAYSLYGNLNLENTNYLNNDEVISRLCFLLSRDICLSGGDYYFINNMHSTTRRVNDNYHKVLKNSIYLFEFIRTSDLVHDKDEVVNLGFSLLVSSHWGVLVRFLKWRRDFSFNQKNEWLDHLKTSLIYVFKINKKLSINVSIKNRMQLILLYFFWVLI